MLQQILNDMYIDPELLAELDEEQKQILFCKMREEQVRRWKLREDQLDEEDKKSIVQPKKSSGKKVTFLVGVDGEPVVVVLGDASVKDDVDTILEERAKRQADLEADFLKRAAEEELDKLVRLSRSTVEAMEEEATRNTQKDRDPAREAVVRSLQEATVEMEGHIQAMEEAESSQCKLPSNITPAQSSLPGVQNTSTTPVSNGAPSLVSSGIGSSKLSLASSASSSSLSSLSSNSSVSLPPSPPAFSISSYGSSQSSAVKKLNGMPLWETAAKPPPASTSTTTAKPPILSPKPTLMHSISHIPKSQSSTQPVVTPNTNGTTNIHSGQSSPPSSISSTTSLMSSLTPSPPPSRSSPSSPRTPSPLSIIEKDENERKQEPTSPSNMVGVAAQIRRFEQLSEGSLEALKTATLERAKKRRQREILEHLRSQVEAARQQVADAANKQSNEKEDIAWQEQERKAKEAERRIREIARRAREEHRRASHHTTPTHAINRNLNGLTHITLLKNGINGHTGNGGDINGNIKTVSDDISNNNQSKISSGSSTTTTVSKNGHVSGCVRQRLRPPKPPSRASIVAWFREEELPRGAGLDPSRMHIAPWFHGIISRTEAEEVLAGVVIGSFLVRVSERIWGYAISYKAADRCRHYLIDVTAGKYTFFGSHQASHETLSDLVEYHRKEPITATGGELLTSPCSQPHPRRPNYVELFTGTHFMTL